MHGFAYNTLNGAVDGTYLLGNGRDDRYDAFTVSTCGTAFGSATGFFGAYTRSRAHTNQVFDFSLDFPLLSRQLPGPYPWDTPNPLRRIRSAVPFFELPILHKIDLVYSPPKYAPACLSSRPPTREKSLPVLLPERFASPLTTL